MIIALFQCQIIFSYWFFWMRDFEAVCRLLCVVGLVDAKSPCRVFWLGYLIKNQCWLSSIPLSL